MTYPPATIARRIACGVCPHCEGPGEPVAARRGFGHEHAGLLCLEHLLAALGVPLQPPRPASAPPDPSEVRGRCTRTGCAESPAARLTWQGRPALANDRPFVAVTAAGEWCAEHAPMQPDPSPTPATIARQTPVQPLGAEALEAALLVMQELGAVPLRSEPTYGAEPEALPHVEAVQGAIPPGDPRMPAAARRMAADAASSGWRVGVRGTEVWCTLRAARGAVRLDVHWAGGRFRTAWVATGHGCVKVGARQAAAILKAIP